MKEILDYEEPLLSNKTYYIRWWESKRLIYNSFIVGCFVIAYLSSDAEIKLNDISYLVLYTTLTLIRANVMYSLGWISQLITKYLSGGQYDLESIKIFMFVFGVLLSIVVSFVCGFLIMRDITVYNRFSYY